MVAVVVYIEDGESSLGCLYLYGGEVVGPGYVDNFPCTCVDSGVDPYDGACLLVEGVSVNRENVSKLVRGAYVSVVRDVRLLDENDVCVAARETINEVEVGAR